MRVIDVFTKIGKIITLFSNIKISLNRLLLFISIAMVVLAMSMVTFFSYKNIIGFLQSKTENINRNNLEQIRSKMENHLLEIENVTSYLANNEFLINYIIEYSDLNQDNTERIKAGKNILYLIQSMQQYNSSTEEIALFIDNGFFTTNTTIYHKYYENDNIYSIGIQLRKMQESTFGEDRIKPIFIEPSASGTQISVESNMENITGNNSLEDIPFKDKFYFFSAIRNQEDMYGSIFVIMKKDWMEELFGPGLPLIIKSNQGDVIWNGYGAKESEIRHLIGSGDKNINIFTTKIKNEKVNIFFMKDLPITTGICFM